MEIFNQSYCGESLYDLSRDIHEAFDPQFNKEAENIPTDEYGFHKGEFTVTVTWKES